MEMLDDIFPFFNLPSVVLGGSEVKVSACNAGVKAVVFPVVMLVVRVGL